MKSTKSRALSQSKHRRSAGFSLIEVVVALAVVSIGLLGFSQAIVGAVVLNQLNAEAATARRAAIGVIGDLQAATFAEAFARYNATAADDFPAGEHMSGGFAVDGLQLRADDADGAQGEIIFPTADGALGLLELREDAVEPRLGMPRDLNADGVIDALDHSADYQLLPVVVRVEWRGRAGPASVEFKTVLSDL